MATPATGTDLAVVYTNQNFVERWLPRGNTNTSWGYLTSQAAGTGPSNTPGLLSIDDLTELIWSCSRWVDSQLHKRFYTPFPAIARLTAVTSGVISPSNPTLPMQIRDLCTTKVCEAIWQILEMGNRREPQVEWMLRSSHAMVDLLNHDPSSLGIIQVRTPEQFQNHACGFGSPYSETGLMTGVWYRLANRNVMPDSLRLVRSDGYEAFRSDGLPFGNLMDYGFLDAAQGTIGFYNNGGIIASIQAVLSNGGGVIYDWSWERLDYGITGAHYPSGVQKS